MQKVILDGLSVGYKRLGRILTEQMRMAEEMQMIRNALSALSGLDEAMVSFGGIQRALEEQRQEMLFFEQGLKEIRSVYDRTEKKICENAEESGYRLWRLDIGT